MRLVNLPIESIRMNFDTQSRIVNDEETIETYYQTICDSKKWPFGPVDVFFDGKEYYLADGFHRTLAALRNSETKIPAQVHQGTPVDAKIFGMTANDKHGLRMSGADKRACVEWLLEHKKNMTQAEVAEKAGVSIRTVERIVSGRKEKNKPANGGSTPKKPANGGSQNGKSSPAPKKAASNVQDDENDDEFDSEFSGGVVTSEGDAVPFDVPESKPARYNKRDYDENGIKYETPPFEQEVKLRTHLKKLIEAAVRIIDELHDIKPNHEARMKAIRAVTSYNLW